MRQVADDMLVIMFDEAATAEERTMAAATLVEAVCPEISRYEPGRCGYHDERRKRCLLNNGHRDECEFD